MIFDANLLQSIALAAAPLVVAAVGEVVVERAGMVNIGIEGMMLVGALGAWLGAGIVGPAVGIGVAVAAGMVLACVFAVAVLRFFADQIVTGTGINLLALGITGMVYRRMEEGMRDRSLPSVSQQTLAWAASAVAVGLAIGVWAFFRFTRAGLELTAIGEAPEAADTAGVAVGRRKLYSLLFGGGCGGWRGRIFRRCACRRLPKTCRPGRGFSPWRL